jgi:hypothetical protein
MTDALTVPSRNRVRLWLVGAAVVALGILGIVVVNRVLLGAHITACGVDTQGRPYAKVRVGSLLGGLGSMAHEQVNVSFNGGVYYGYTTIKVPVLGTTTTTVGGGPANFRSQKVWAARPRSQKVVCTVHEPTNGWQ